MDKRIKGDNNMKKYPMGYIQMTNKPVIFLKSKLVKINNVDHFMNICINKNFKGKGFCLNSYYDWDIIKDKSGNIILVPTKGE